MRKDAVVPQYRPDIYSPEAIRDPYPHYARLRELGPVVWLPRQKVYAVTTYAECKAVLLDEDTYISGEGVGLNPVVNRLSRGTTLNSDGEVHARRRKLLAHRLTPRALKSMTSTIDAYAEQVVTDAIKQRRVDGVSDLAVALPLSFVPDLIGWPHDGRDNLLRWAAATFDALGPINRQALKAATPSTGMLRFSRRVVRKRSVLEGSMGHDVLRAADDGKLTHSECPALMVDYMAPSLDTTIGAISSAVYLFARHPEQWQAVREDHSLIPNAVNEVVRLEAPLRAFARKTVKDVELGGVTIPRGARVLVIYASANRDSREWTNPDDFDIHRDATRQLGFGIGTHGCGGQGLARLEAQAMLRALAERVERVELAGPPKWGLNNVIHRLESLPLELIPVGGKPS